MAYWYIDNLILTWLDDFTSSVSTNNLKGRYYMSDKNKVISSEYGENSIDSKSGCYRVRDLPHNMLGSSGLQGAMHGIDEIAGNALDEASTGNGTKLDVVFYEDGSISIRDYGRGVPLGWNDNKGTYNWHLIYNEMFAGAKYSKHQKELRAIKDWSTFNPKDYNYLFSVGLNGLGAASTQYTSEFFTVKSYRENPEGGRICTTVHFENGLPIFDGKKVDVFNDTGVDVTTLAPETEKTDEPTGTFVHWKPDYLVFSDVDIPEDYVLNKFTEIACTAGLTVNFEGRQSGISKVIKSGTLDGYCEYRYGNSLVRDEETDVPFILSPASSTIHHGEIMESGKNSIWVAELDYRIAFTRSGKEDSCFHNLVPMKRGVQYTAISTALQKFFIKVGADFSVSIKANDYVPYISCVISTKSNIASYSGQVKDSLDSSFLGTVIVSALTEKLMTEYGKRNAQLMVIIDAIIKEAQLRAEIEASSKLLRSYRSKMKNISNSDKFYTCIEYDDKDYHRTELFIVEGDSAKWSVVDARDKRFQAVIPVRGKGLNVLKKSIDRIVKNVEIATIFDAIGTGMEIVNVDTCDASACRFDKIIFATDADVDGKHIRVILFLVFLRLAPDLLRPNWVDENGNKVSKIFIAETPLYDIQISNGQHLMAYSDEEKDDIVSKHTVVNISRMKGLGECDADWLRETTIAPENRRLIPLIMDFNNSELLELFDILYGKDKYHLRKPVLKVLLGCDVSDSFGDDVDFLNVDEDDDADDFEEDEID